LISGVSKHQAEALLQIRINPKQSNNNPIFMEDDYMPFTNQQTTVLTILQLLKAGKSDKAITEHINNLGLKTPRGLDYSLKSIEQEIWKIRNPANHFKSSLYSEMLMLIVSGQLSFKDAAAALYSVPRPATRTNVSFNGASK
jgi:hypothetical protein